jgi:hypothetical protein
MWVLELNLEEHPFEIEHYHIYEFNNVIVHTS